MPGGLCFYMRWGRPGLDETHPKNRTQVDLTIGSALDIFGGELSYRDVVEWDKRNGYI